MLNIVHDNPPNLNVWTYTKIYLHSFCPRYNEQLPKFLHLIDNLSFHSSADGLDNFIYPVMMAEPYIFARSLIANYNPRGGFWSYVSDSVIKGLREKRGWIIIDIFSEPISQYDFDCVLESLSESTTFPNDRILINITSPYLAAVNEKVLNYPSFQEISCLYQTLRPGLYKSRGICSCNPYRLKKASYPHKRFLLLNNYIDFPSAYIFAKYARKYPDSFLDSSCKVNKSKDKSPNFLLLPEAIFATDLNIVMEAYDDNEMIDYPFVTEKTYRNIKYKKPFIIMGQHHILASLHKQGYKTFHPLIDESYDTIKDTKLRSLAVLREIVRLRQMTDDEWYRLIENCKPILEHNHNNLRRRIKQTSAWLEGLKDL